MNRLDGQLPLLGKEQRFLHKTLQAALIMTLASACHALAHGAEVMHSKKSWASSENEKEAVWLARES
jgi:hypothetical protein